MGSYKLLLVTEDKSPEATETADPTDAEFFYWTFTRARFSKPTRLILETDSEAIVPSAKFALDRTWTGPRELSERRRALWADNAEEYQAPTVWQLRGAARFLDWSGSEIARRLDISDRVWRYFISTDEDRREIPWPLWYLLRSWIGNTDMSVDSGFVNMWVSRFRAIATKAQLRTEYQSELDRAVTEFSEHVSLVKSQDALAATNKLIGTLRLEIEINETPEELLPQKLTDRTLNLADRNSALRKVITLIESHIQSIVLGKN